MLCAPVNHGVSERFLKDTKEDEALLDMKRRVHRSSPAFIVHYDLHFDAGRGEARELPHGVDKRAERLIGGRERFEDAPKIVQSRPRRLSREEGELGGAFGIAAAFFE